MGDLAPLSYPVQIIKRVVTKQLQFLSMNDFSFVCRHDIQYNDTQHNYTNHKDTA